MGRRTRIEWRILHYLYQRQAGIPHGRNLVRAVGLTRRGLATHILPLIADGLVGVSRGRIRILLGGETRLAQIEDAHDPEAGAVELDRRLLQDSIPASLPLYALAV